MVVEDWLSLLSVYPLRLDEGTYEGFHDWCEENNHPYLCVSKFLLYNFIESYSVPNDYWVVIQFTTHFYLNSFIDKIYNKTIKGLKSNTSFHKMNYCYSEHMNKSFDLAKSVVTLHAARKDLHIMFDLIVEAVKLFNSIK